MSLSIFLDLLSHNAAHERKKPYKCGICDLNFSENNEMESHIDAVCKRKKPFNCDVFNTATIVISIFRIL